MRGIQISQQSDVPIYQQLFEQISSQILKGELKRDFNLPPIRTAARELRVSIITVKKAWEELERAGLIYTVTGKGCFVTGMSEKELAEKRNSILDVQMNKDIVFYKNLDASRDEMVTLVEKQYAPF